MALRLRTVYAAIALSTSALLLSGCVPSETVTATNSPTVSSTPTHSAPEATATPSASASATKSATPTPSPTPSKSAQDTAVSFGCNDLVSPSAMYDFNPNFLLLGSFTPDSGTTAAAALSAKGVACRWQNGTNSTSIDVSVAQPTSSKLATFKSNAGSSADAFSGYFSITDRIGTAQIFVGPYWATLSSREFTSADEASNLVAEVRAALQ
ncbi:arginyl-tRNA synthetase [Salinibacterium sp. UTAS2018]|uniref:arginyl-tRNA synthetase n=1 Tax=Salinibacterium sp. UTAS2018 TaxID=2508880 RepID=UPI001009671C|nr:arginyl-tRNA synthetase [Salinibacterium sp. UTAS2018]QAV69125.1 arginyl-tRNA synthetase [Salinibacterium sp. UTAS2018]